MTLPNFFIIGAARSGTTALYRYLMQHPEIYMSPHKEPRFFAFEGEKPEFQGPAGWIINQNTVTDKAAYLELFRDAAGAAAIGDASPIYLYSGRAPERIREAVPQAKLIAILRNPVDRAFSSFMYLTMHGHEPIADFRRALAEEDGRIRENWAPLYHYKARGFYHRQLKRFFELFDAGQIHVCLYEDLMIDQRSLMRDLFGFLGVNTAFDPDFSSRPNVSGLPKSRALHRLVQAARGRGNIITATIKPLIPARQRELCHQVLNSVTRRNLERPKVPEDLRNELTRMFREDILKLQDLINRDLSRWIGQKG